MRAASTVPSFNGIHGGPLVMAAVCRPAAASEEEKTSEEDNR